MQKCRGRSRGADLTQQPHPPSHTHSHTHCTQLEQRVGAQQDLQGSHGPAQPLLEGAGDVGGRHAVRQTLVQVPARRWIGWHSTITQAFPWSKLQCYERAGAGAREDSDRRTKSQLRNVSRAQPQHATLAAAMPSPAQHQHSMVRTWLRSRLRPGPWRCRRPR